MTEQPNPNRRRFLKAGLAAGAAAATAGGVTWWLNRDPDAEEIRRMIQADGVVPARYFETERHGGTTHWYDFTHGIDNPARCVPGGIVASAQYNRRNDGDPAQIFQKPLKGALPAWGDIAGRRDRDRLCQQPGHDADHTRGA